ncbi:DEAD/DEAH box helicase [Clostridium gasigenes]|uniref:ATP-dependent RNA helicase CshA n=1 Tax=Clostridium gasigenes TaxID=94869 RepID=A0A1H0NNS8_9CLOT|nr:DEAD/DEAH box helicase [Clostridium gasigenes]MBB6623639.1 DEAD/DEAH box helicase [Clostridium gasigenes]MBU3087560.1 DEAD/DEAH box helicase [Clostridium gasigenes]NKF05526.1 DEAD/DEAH box helicase [Clostridium gasigenes]QSW18969.1 DEAD/DEAH box helicase [Clostridium gasigenes]SDO94000.1 ATP-dependent RNA helicase RhlE [Clostridium gasigenes]
MLFENLNIIEPILKALKEEGYTKPTPIQEKSIPHLINGKDILGCAQTGTGKTAAFAIPVLQNIFTSEEAEKGPKQIKALILAPTRELAIQIEESFTAYGKHLNIKNLVIFGGVPQNPQTRALKQGVDVLIATPGRLIDLINQKFIDLQNVKYFILDEADRMLDMGMINDVKKIIARLPKVRQNMLFSATMPNEVSKLVDSILRNPVKVEVAPVSSTVDRISQGIYFVSRKNKKSLLVDILKDESIASVLVFSRTKRGANVITKELENAGIEAQAIHGDKSQNARQLALKNFKEGKIRVLVATDIAARGIDVDELSHVINFDLPEVPETYVHRIGRTGRAGLEGVALSFCCEEEKELLRYIEKLTAKKVPVIGGHIYPITADEAAFEKQETAKKNARISARSGSSRSNSSRSDSNRSASSRSSSNRDGSSRNTSNKNGSSRSSSSKDDFANEDSSKKTRNNGFNSRKRN